MLKRDIRQRKEYLYRKSIEAEQRTLENNKRIIKKAIQNSEEIPHHLRKDAIDLAKEIEYDNTNNNNDEDLITHLDDEYQNVGMKEPRIVVSTSSKPSRALQQFSKEICLIFPNCQKINRGSLDIKSLVEICNNNSVTDLLMVTETHGIPNGLIVSHLPYGPSAFFTLHNVLLRHSLKENNLPGVSQNAPHLVFHDFHTQLGHRIMNILKFLFPTPKYDTNRTVTFYNSHDIISLRHHSYKNDKKQVNLIELGPRMDLQPYKIVLGTLKDISTAEVEWVYRPYINSSNKKALL